MRHRPMPMPMNAFHNTLLNTAPISVPLAEKMACNKKEQPFGLMPCCKVLFSHKRNSPYYDCSVCSSSRFKALCLTAVFPSKALWRGRVTPLLTFHWLSPAGSSNLIGWEADQERLGRFSFVYMLVQKTPITTVTLGSQTIYSYRQTDTWGCRLSVHVHMHPRIWIMR